MWWNGEGGGHGGGVVIFQKVKGQQTQGLPHGGKKQACAADSNAAEMTHAYPQKEPCMDSKALDFAIINSRSDDT